MFIGEPEDRKVAGNHCNTCMCVQQIELASSGSWLDRPAEDIQEINPVFTLAKTCK